MKTLYRGDYNSIIYLLNQSFYVKDYDVIDRIVIHTGFTFKIHTDTQFELLFDYFDHKLIYQPTSFFKFPVIAGLHIYNKDDLFFKTYINTYIIDKIVENSQTFTELPTDNEHILSNNYQHQFEILNTDSEVIDSFPLINEYRRKFFNGRNEFLPIEE